MRVKSLDTTSTPYSNRTATAAAVVVSIVHPITKVSVDGLVFPRQGLVTRNILVLYTGFSNL